ncbi:nitroreductase [Polynucleobacter sp. 15G-AUS-farblos]|uniref:nitroreductase n=1 Tax=Polynucleobacter sp. 15G-AUS-farblos TaxID=2689094 RepID=UPI001C0B4088|nr:nitroreductase [Polynucleobacter sp. 15G-AUS-farblos]MBU3584229.1 nitroreductase [Polynucleobacter sp. 15G-AUS-farblos]
MSNSTVDDVIQARMSARAFTSEAPSRELIQHILQVASRAPSGTNTQPWKVYVLEGNILAELCDKVCDAYEAISNNPELADQYKEAYSYYPEKWFSPYIDRRRENGWSLYGLLGIEKGEKEKMFLQHQRNFRFFDAPVGLFFTIHRDLGTGSILDYGMFLQNIMVSAQSHGLASCPQAAWNKFSKIILPAIGATSEEMLVCGMALGYADQADKVNTFQTPRAKVDEFTSWLK